MGERVLGDVGTRLLFENDRVKAWELRLAPGEDSSPHRHALDHLLIQLSGDKVAVIPEPDTEGQYQDYLEADVIPGMTMFVQRGDVAKARHNSSVPTRQFILVLQYYR